VVNKAVEGGHRAIGYANARSFDLATFRRFHSSEDVFSRTVASALLPCLRRC
jgi:hypothetical protein